MPPANSDPELIQSIETDLAAIKEQLELAEAGMADRTTDPTTAAAYRQLHDDLSSRKAAYERALAAALGQP